jgi:hypothetical protein
MENRRLWTKALLTSKCFLLGLRLFFFDSIVSLQPPCKHSRPLVICASWSLLGLREKVVMAVKLCLYTERMITVIKFREIDHSVFTRRVYRSICNYLVQNFEYIEILSLEINIMPQYDAYK